MKQPTGYVVYTGPSRFSPDVPLVVIMTMHSRNDKTGNIVQTWILRQDIPPFDAVQKNVDDAICGMCVHRLQRTCYVQVSRAPNKIYQTWLAGKYPQAPTKLSRILAGRALRIGSYGDPAAVPFTVWAELARYSAGHTGYTHFWRENPELATYCMASVDSPTQRVQAKALGFRTFRPKHSWQPRLPGEAHCPASSEAGKKLTCLTCMACDGASRALKGDVTLDLHGVRGSALRVA